MNKKTLIIIAHPNLENSVVNKSLINELSKFTEKYVLHDLYASYPDGIIDINVEQKRLLEFEKIVLQFPFYWFSSPPLLKKWLDEVLIEGYAFGKGNSFALKNKTFSLSISTGSSEKTYQENGKYKYTISQLLAPFELTFDYIKVKYAKPFILYGSELEDLKTLSDNSVKDYLKFLDDL